MNRTLRLALFLLAASPFLRAQETEKIPAPGDFYGTITLTGTAGRLLGLEIPEAVYRGLQRSDMGDIRVFDAEGLPVPFMIRDVPGTRSVPPPEDVPFFLWEQENGEALPAGADITIDASGTILRINGPHKGADASPAWLLDLSGFSYAPRSLSLTMNAEGYYNSAVRVHSSADLSLWREFDRQIIAWYGDSGASRSTIELPGDKARYILLQFEKKDLAPRAVSARFNTVEIPPETGETAAEGSFKDKKRRVVTYHTGGFYPVTSIRFRLQDADSVTADVKNRYAEDGDWRLYSRINLYNYRSGAETVTNEALAISSNAPWWELEAVGEQSFSSLPECTIRWTVRELIFPGRGAGPWTLAFGNGDYGPPGDGGFKLPSDNLRLSENAEGGIPEIETAGIAGAVQYSSEKPVKHRPERDWGQIILWTVLVLAVLILSGLAFYIAKVMGKSRQED